MDLRVLWASTGCHVNTGYGKVSRYVLSIMRSLGIDVVAYNAQLLGGATIMNGVPQLPRGSDTFGSDTIPIYYRMYQRNLLITLWDVWVLHWIRNHVLNWVPYTPIDAELDEYTYEINEPLNYPQCIAIIAMSEFGKRQVEKVVRDKHIYVVPHGVDTSIYYPRPREEARKVVGVPRDAFIFGCVAANIGDRKDLPTLLKAFRIFLDSNPDAREVYLLLWSNTKPSPGTSFDLARIGKRLGIAERVVTPAMQPPNVFYDESVMPMVYSSMDYYVTASRGEGFGLPLLEAMACGVPCIAPDNSAQSELVGDRGILVRPRYEIYTLTTPTHQIYKAVDPHDLAEAMTRAYNAGASQSLRRRCIEFAKSLSWDKIAVRWREVLERISEAI